MIIRSQDKCHIINFQKVDTVCLGGIEGKIVITFTSAQVVTLGTYSTEEKAIEVLDRIAKKYSRYQCLKACGRISEEDAIFQMPSDESVEV